MLQNYDVVVVGGGLGGVVAAVLRIDFPGASGNTGLVLNRILGHTAAGGNLADLAHSVNSLYC